jgi:choline dehydrogenase-like flavoprotein
VVEITVEDGARAVSGLRVATLNGRQLRVVAKAYVLACGGVENPRLLLASNRVVPSGLGNQRDLVGRYFMDHPYVWVGRFEPADPRFDRTLHVIEGYDQAGIEQRAHAALTLADGRLRAEGLNGCVAYFVRRSHYKTQPAYTSPAGSSFMRLIDVLKHEELPNRHFGRHLRNTMTGLGDVGQVLGQQLRQLAAPRLDLGVRMVLETTPNPDSRVVLSERRDALGVPHADVDWRINDSDRRGLHQLATVMQDELARLGLGRLVLSLTEDESGWPSCMTGGKHHMGTTRMHPDPGRGVVDADCKVHDLANLFVAGSSVFPTGGYANPTLTIVALAVRLADHLKERFRAGRF